MCLNRLSFLNVFFAYADNARFRFERLYDFLYCFSSWLHFLNLRNNFPIRQCTGCNPLVNLMKQNRAGFFGRGFLSGNELSGPSEISPVRFACRCLRLGNYSVRVFRSQVGSLRLGVSWLGFTYCSRLFVKYRLFACRFNLFDKGFDFRRLALFCFRGYAQRHTCFHWRNRRSGLMGRGLTDIRFGGKSRFLQM